MIKMWYVLYHVRVYVGECTPCGLVNPCLMQLTLCLFCHLMQQLETLSELRRRNALQITLVCVVIGRASAWRIAVTIRDRFRVCAFGSV